MSTSDPSRPRPSRRRPPSGRSAAPGPAAAPLDLQPQDLLVLPLHQQLVTRIVTDASGTTGLQLRCGDKTVAYDEPSQFDFGLALARQSRFAAGDAIGWGEGCEWPRVGRMLQQLLDQGLLERADLPAQQPPLADGAGATAAPAVAGPVHGTAAAAGLPAQAPDPAWLELVVPVFRVAPAAPQAGPLTLGAAQRLPLFALLRALRGSYLQRYPAARVGLTVSDLARLAVAVQVLPAYQAQRPGAAAPAGAPHPVLSALSWLAEGLRQSAQQMLFGPLGEPRLAADARISSREVLDYAAQHLGFHTARGERIAAPELVEAFLAVLVDGQSGPERGPAPVQGDAALQQVLADLDPALDYALLGLQAHVALCALWPVLVRNQEILLQIAEDWAGVAADAEPVRRLRYRLRGQTADLRSAGLLPSEPRRLGCEAVLAELHQQCGRGLGPLGGQGLRPAQTAQRRAPRDPALVYRCTWWLQQRFGQAEGAAGLHLMQLRDALVAGWLQTQAILQVADDAQSRINRLLGRPPAERPFSVGAVDLRPMLPGPGAARVPLLLDELGPLLGLRAVVGVERIALTGVDAPA